MENGACYDQFRHSPASEDCTISFRFDRFNRGMERLIKFPGSSLPYIECVTSGEEPMKEDDAAFKGETEVMEELKY